jgi:rRNA maturation endonuclease Nob1
MDDTMCWSCDKEYPFFYHNCPYCGATNANIYYDQAQKEAVDKTLIRKPSNENHT